MKYAAITNQQRPQTPAEQLAGISDLLNRLTAQDRGKFLSFGWGQTIAPRFATIADAILFHMRDQPAAIAAEFGGQQLSYGALDRASNQLAAALRKQGVRQGDAVCLYLRRSLEMVVGIVAIMKLGAAYVPQHVGVAPAKTLRHIASVTGAKVILTRADLAHLVPVEPGQTLISIDTLNPSDTAFTAARSQPTDRAIVLFTSGTTGVPNGVQVTQANLANVLLTAPGDLGMRPGQRVAQILSIAFDMAAWETLGALANGATLVIRGKSIQETVETVDIVIATPSILNALNADRCQQIKTAAVAGEPCPRPLADKWAGFCTFYNSCGPTETTIINTAARHSAANPILSIGSPTPNNSVYILDDLLMPLPIGSKGEMWAGGACVTAGYLANPALTSARYRPDPFRPGQMMFRTRDIGRWTDDGTLEHLGRVDDLVKIRGFRVELGGVSNVLERAAGCAQAVTLKYDDTTLVSFISPASARPELAAEKVAKCLPYYCSPTVILALDELPRTARGKLDKPLLLKLAADHLAQQCSEAAQ
ncbi:MAG: amino acid adenylation domain-containing protein [Rhodobacteraceae bacterium]|nr:amino acid adenylation domain-containing protein [Paracoccaceae bacterium]PHR54559.1 MAG: peptide synthetase [Robiginitomaculum sp.]